MSERATKMDLSRVARLLRYARPYRAQWAQIALLTLLITGVTLLLPWPMLILIDYVLGSVPMPGWLAWLAGLMPESYRAGMLIGWIVCAGLVLFLLSAWLDALLTCASVRVGQRMVYDLAEDLFDRVQRRSLVFHTRSNVGDLLLRIVGDSFCVHSMVDLLLLSPARAVITTVFMVALMAWMDWKLTIVALFAAPLMASASYWLAPPIRLASKVRREVESRLLAHVQQTLSGISVVQAFAAEQREQQRFREFADAAIGAQKRTTVATQFHQLGTGLIATVGAALILWLGVRHVLAGTLTLGKVLLFLGYLGTLQEQMKVFVGMWSNTQSLSANVDRVSEILDQPSEVVEKPTAIELPRARGELRFEDVTFGYALGRPVLQEVCLDISAGMTVAIVGSSGAGKSTLVSLVPRFSDPWSGRILLDGHDLRDLKLKSLRRQVAVVLQEAFLFPMTVAQNIAYGSPDATRDQVVAAARAAGADAFIQQLPDGYDTLLAERGSSLSGGERQRLSIARALLKDAPILILDEPTASLDAVTEAGLLEALKVLMKDRTTLVIAHRLSTIRNADRIVVVDEGGIVEMGTHEELIDLDGIYADLHAKQTGRRRMALMSER